MQQPHRGGNQHRGDQHDAVPAQSPSRHGEDHLAQPFLRDHRGAGLCMGERIVPNDGMMFDHPVAQSPMPARVAIRADERLSPVRQQDSQKERDPDELAKRWQPPRASRGRWILEGGVSHDTRVKTSVNAFEYTRVHCGLSSRIRFSGCCTGRIVHLTSYLANTASHPGLGPSTMRNSRTRSSP